MRDAVQREQALIKRLHELFRRAMFERDRTGRADDIDECIDTPEAAEDGLNGVLATFSRREISRDQRGSGQTCFNSRFGRGVALRNRRQGTFGGQRLGDHSACLVATGDQNHFPAKIEIHPLKSDLSLNRAGS